MTSDANQIGANKIGMIRYYVAIGLQIVGLFITMESLLLFFGDMGPMMRTAAIGAGVFYAGRLVGPKNQ